MNFSIADKLENVRKRIQKATIQASRVVGDVDLLAVSKKKPASLVYEAFQSGQKKFGENYLNEALEKQEAVSALIDGDKSDNIEWHFIGPIQSNKTRLIAEHFPWVHGVDRLKIARRLNEQRPENLEPLNVCIQVNIDEEESKSGILLADLPEIAREIDQLPRLKLRGLMCIPKARKLEEGLSEDKQSEELARAFSRMHDAYNELKAHYDSVDTLSMGMSGDMDVAVQHGSTMVRIGTAIFGDRDS